MTSILNSVDRDDELRDHRTREGALTIRVSCGTGEGRTRISAFDAALRSAGVADFNLIRLSSVIPAGSTVVRVPPPSQLGGGFGDALYCVYAVGWASVPGNETWAGVAWSRRLDGSDAGLFVEHSAMSEADVRHDLRVSLEDLAANRGGGYEFAGDAVTSVRCLDRPVCALAVATYECAPWGGR